MKIVRPENNTPTPKLMAEPQIKQGDDIFVDDNTGKNQTIENLMNEIINQKDDRVQVTINLTKRQYDLYLKKGGESWLKKVITGQQVKKKSTKKR